MTGPSYGAQVLDLTPPNGAIHARLDDDFTPQQILADRMRDVPPGGTVVIHEGDWPVEIVPPRQKPFTIQAAPGVRPRLVGYNVVEPQHWNRGDGPWWWIDWAPFDATPNAAGLIDPAHPYASWPEQVWIDGVPATMAHPLASLNPGEFLVSSPPDLSSRLYIADDPAEHEIWVAVRQQAFTGSQDGNPRVDLYGLDVVGYATTSRRRAAVTVFADGTIVHGLRVVECSAAGISARGHNVRLDHIETLGNGQLGIHAWQAHGLDIGHAIISGNNRRDFSRMGEAGGAKWFDTIDVVAHDNLLVKNNGHALWADGGSDRSQFLRNDLIGDGVAAGIHFEISRDGRAWGNRATAFEVGILGSGCHGFDVAHNTVTGNEDDIRFQGDHTDCVRRGNRTSPQVDRDAIPSPAEVAALDLTGNDAVDHWTGWYGPTPTPPEEPPMPEPWNATPILDAHYEANRETDAAIAEIRRLEAEVTGFEAERDALRDEVDHLQAIIDTDDHLARIAELEELLKTTGEHLWNTALTVNTLRDTVTTLNGSVANLTMQAVAVGEQRDTALAHAQQLELRYADDRLTIADLTQRLHDCEADTGKEPEVNRIVVGGSHKRGWSALKTMTAPARPGAYRLFASTPRLTVAHLNAIVDVQDDGAIPYVSVTKIDEGGDARADADHNAGELIRVDAYDHAGAIIPVHEPTGKMPGPEFVAMVTAALPVYRDLLPNWERLLCFMAFDFRDQALDRHPANYLAGFDWSLATGLAVDVYDKDPNNAKTFAQLMANAEAFAREHGLPIHVLEAGAPDTGQYGRRAGWKPDWYEDAYEHMLASDVDYRTFLVFNGLGPDSPPSVPSEGDVLLVKAGWYADTTPEARAAYIRCIERSRA